MPLILANSYQITSILHMVLSTVTVSVFIEFFFVPPDPLSPSPFFLVFWGVFLRNFGAQVSAHLRLSSLDIYVSGIFRIIPRGYFFFVWPNVDFCSYWRNFGPKICGERSVCPMVTKLSGFGQYLGRNQMKVENLDFGHGIVLFWYWKPFWDQKYALP